MGKISLSACRNCKQNSKIQVMLPVIDVLQLALFGNFYKFSISACIEMMITAKIEIYFSNLFQQINSSKVYAKYDFDCSSLTGKVRSGRSPLKGVPKTFNKLEKA